MSQETVGYDDAMRTLYCEKKSGLAACLPRLVYTRSPVPRSVAKRCCPDMPTPHLEVNQTV